MTAEAGALRRLGSDPLRLALLAIRLGPALILLLLIVIMSMLSPAFLTVLNLGNVLAQSAVIAVLAIGQLLVILTRGIDLSVGSTLALASVTGALVYSAVPSGPVVVLAMLATGMAVGAINGMGYVLGRLPHPFIITLATLSAGRGLALWLSGGQPQQGMPEIVQTMGGGSAGWLPYSAFLVAAVALAVLLLTTRMVWGRWIYAVGGNPEAARRAAIPVDRVVISVYVLSGLAAGIAAIVTSGRLNAGSPTFGDLAELDSIAAVVIGGASFLGGRGGVGNALVGALMIGIIRNGMNLLDVDAFLQPIVIGVVIVLAVESDVVRGRLEGRFRIARAARS
ncbi:ABC transporter permease [Nonomuraea sp. 3N208]|uniref:ABC transporter permease n=1 Tax=Nonomuraea sp. 3N208 TaxID=3457421 RepID=UPI003FCF56A1